MYQEKCQICKLNLSSTLKCLISYPKFIYNKQLQNIQQRQIHTLNNYNIQQLDLNHNHVCFQIDNNICQNCWQFIYEGFYCSKCKNYNNYHGAGLKICCFCKSNYCSKCDQQLDLFSQNQLCNSCEKDQILYLIKFIVINLIIALIPFLTYFCLLRILIKTTLKANYSFLKQQLVIISFTILFPIIYILCAIALLILLLLKIMSLLIGQDEKTT